MHQCWRLTVNALLNSGINKQIWCYEKRFIFQATNMVKYFHKIYHMRVIYVICVLTQIYNLSSGSHMTHFLTVVAKKWKIWSKSLFWNERTQGADSRWEQQSYFTSTSSNFSIIYFQIDIVFQLKYYQSPNHYYFYYLAIKRRNFL